MANYSKKSTPHRRSDMEGDLGSPTIIQELLQAGSEWSQIPDIIKLTFKAVFDVTKVHEDTIKELSKTMNSKASKTELNQKASISDVSKTVAEVATNIESRVTLEELQQLLDTKANKSDLQHYLKPKGSEELSTKSKIELETMKSRLEQIQSDISRTVNSSLKELKESQKTLKESLNKNKDELNTALSKKIEVEDIHNIIESLKMQINSEDIEKLNKSLEEATDRIEEIERLINDNGGYNKQNELAKINDGKRLINIEKEINVLHTNINDEVKKLSELIELKKNDWTKIIDERMNTNSIVATIGELRSTFETELEEVKIQIDNKINKNVKIDQEAIGSLQDEIKKLKESLSNINDEQQTNMKTLKVLATTSRSDKQEEQRELRKELIAFRKEIDLLAQEKCDRKEIQDFKLNVNKELEVRVTLDEIKKALGKIKTETARRLIEITEENKNEIQGFKEIVYTELEKKGNKDLIFAELEKKANTTDMEIFKSRVGNLQAEINKKANANEFDTQSVYVKESIEVLKREITLKSNIKDVCALVDIKADLEDVDKGLEELSNEMATKADTEELKATLAKQMKLTEILCTENCAGRWLWKSGTLKSGCAVPWEIQTINTCPDNFLWEKNKISILTVAAGLYEVSIGFFASKKPKVQFLVNGEPILSPSKVIK